MDVTFVLEESGVTATVEVPCEADAAAAKEVACRALAVSPASVQMRIGTEVVEGTCRLQDTAFDAGTQVVLAACYADMKCPAEHSFEGYSRALSLSPCGTLCVYINTHKGKTTYVGFDTETFETAFTFESKYVGLGPVDISRCKTRCNVVCEDRICVIALPGGEVLREIDLPSQERLARGTVVVSRGGVSVYDGDLTLLRSLSHEGCAGVAMSHCGGWVITSDGENASLWDVNSGEAVVVVPTDGLHVSLSRSASVFAVMNSDAVQLYDWSGAALGSCETVPTRISGVEFTPCGKYVIIQFESEHMREGSSLHQYDVATMSCVRVIPSSFNAFVISPCSRVVLFESSESDVIMSRHLYPY